MTDTGLDTADPFSVPDIPVQVIHDPLLESRAIKLSVLRLDLVHPVISGNKWFKLKNNLAAAKSQGKDTLLSFGGPWSNHLHALAAAGQAFGFNTIGIVRGELHEPLNPCLADAQHAGMVLEAISRAEYANKSSPEFLSRLQSRHGNFYMIPEGGANLAGVQGCADIPALYNQADFDLVCMACGTGTMLAGMALTSVVPLLGVQVLKGNGYLEGEVAKTMQEFDMEPACRWSIVDDWHHGGYAKVSPELMAFLTEFEQRHGIPLEPVYSGKLLHGILTAIKKRDFFPQNSSILAIHGGGLQGMRGFI